MPYCNISPFSVHNYEKQPIALLIYYASLNNFGTEATFQEWTQRQMLKTSWDRVKVSGSLTIQGESEPCLHPSAPSLHNVIAICFHSLAKCADGTTKAAYNRVVTLNKFPGEEPNDILSLQEICATFLSLLCRETVSSVLRML